MTEFTLTTTVSFIHQRQKALLAQDKGPCVLCFSPLTYFSILLYLAHAQKTPEGNLCQEKKKEPIFKLGRFLWKLEQ